MKRKFLPRVLSVFLAFSMISPAFAAAVAEVEHADTNKIEYNQEQFDNKDYVQALENNPGSTLRLLDNVETTGPVDMAGDNQTLDLNGFTLTVNAGEGREPKITTAVEFRGTPGGSTATIKDGSIVLNAPNAEEDKTVSAVDAPFFLNLEGVDISGTEGTNFDSAISGAIPIVNVTDSTIDAGSGNIIQSILDDGVYDNIEKELGAKPVNVVSGQVTGELGDLVGKAQDSTDHVEPSDKNMVVVSPDTAAVVQGEDGKYHTFSDLNKAVEKSGDQPVTVLKADDVANLDIKADTTLNLVAGKDVEGLDKAIEDALAKSPNSAAYVKGDDGKYHTYGDLSKAVEASKGAPVVVTDENALADLKVAVGDKLNLVDASGNKLNDKVNLGSDLILNADGTVAARPIVRPDPGTWEPIGPIEPIGPSEVEIDDPDTPLAGFPIDLKPEDKLTRGMLVSILHWMDEAPAAELASFIDVAADSDYAEAIGWASANGIANGVGGNKFAPEDGVTRGQLVTMLNRYAKYVGSDVTAELNGDANEIVTWAVAEEIINDFFARLYA